MSQLNKWMVGGKISKLVVVITDKETGDHIERWQFDVRTFEIIPKPYQSRQHPFTGPDIQQIHQEEYCPENHRQGE